MSLITVDHPDFGSFVMNVHDSDDRYISHAIRTSGSWEPFESRVVARLLEANVEFFDVGANIGWYSVLAGKKLESRGTIHSFEPVPENASVLAANVAANGLDNIRVNRFALGRSCGTVPIFLSPDNKGDHRAYPSCEERQSIQVGMQRFDGYFDRSTRKALLIKMDTQGFEYDIIVGMGDILDVHCAEIAMVIEFWPHGLAQNGVEAETLIGALAKHQFTPWVLWEGEPWLRPCRWEDLAIAARTTLAPASQGYVNLFLSRERAGLARLLDGFYCETPSRLVPPT